MGVNRNKRREVIRLKEQAGQWDINRPKKQRRRGGKSNDRKTLSHH